MINLLKAPYLTHQPLQWTVPSGRLIYPPHIWVDTPTCGVTRGKILTWLLMANKHHTWRKNRDPLTFLSFTNI